MLQQAGGGRASAHSSAGHQVVADFQVVANHRRFGVRHRLLVLRRRAAVGLFRRAVVLPREVVRSRVRRRRPRLRLGIRVRLFRTGAARFAGVAAA